jgi:hypothetical protein
MIDSSVDGEEYATLEAIPTKAVTIMSTVQLSQQVSASPSQPASAPHGRRRPEAVQIESSYNEQITKIVDRLRKRYPAEQVSREDLESRVRGFYHQFDTARIRTFIAIFVERLARRSIEQSSVPAAGGVG